MRFRYYLSLLALLFVTDLSAAPDGRALFVQHCAACHGQDGRGGVGVPLSLPDFLGSVDDRYLFESIRQGRPGRTMPAFQTLSDAQVDAIVHHIRGWEPEGLKSSLVSATVDGDRLRGKKLYDKRCAKCHGTNGEGGEGTGVTFSRPRDHSIIAPALNNSGFLASASDQVIKATLVRGRKGTPMGSLLEKGLNEQDINDIVSYVRSFEERPIVWSHDSAVETVLEMESSYGLEETIENIKRAAIGKNFRIIRIQTLENGLFPEEEENKKQIMVYFCNFSFINKALGMDPRVGLFLPCRITAVEQDGVVKLMAINPNYLARLYNNSGLDAACQEMYDLYYGIMEEATL
jgi:cytochrome c oxidase cbb3-type subunit 3